MGKEARFPEFVLVQRFEQNFKPFLLGTYLTDISFLRYFNP